MARSWFGSNKLAEECGELVQELMKLQAFPDGKHPSRKRSLMLSTEDELGDTMAAINYFIDRNKLDRKRIEKRAKLKYRKFSTWWGVPKVVAKLFSRKKLLQHTSFQSTKRPSVRSGKVMRK